MQPLRTLLRTGSPEVAEDMQTRSQTTRQDAQLPHRKTYWGSTSGWSWERAPQPGSCLSNASSQPQRSFSGPSVLNVHHKILPHEHPPAVCCTEDHTARSILHHRASSGPGRLTPRTGPPTLIPSEPYFLLRASSGRPSSVGLSPELPPTKPRTHL